MVIAVLTEAKEIEQAAGIGVHGIKKRLAAMGISRNRSPTIHGAADTTAR